MLEQAALSESVPPLVGALPPQCRRDLDALRRHIRESIARGPREDAADPAAFREVLLTGATGFLGRFVLRELLRQDSCLNVHCLVRAEDEANGFERIRAALVEAEVWEESFATRMRIVVGDICQERLGLSGSDFDSLSHRLDAVYHLAVDVNLTSSYSAIRKINVLGFFSILELCLSARFKHLFFASTMSVFPQYFFGFANEFKGCAIGHQMQPDLTEMKKKFPVAMLGYPWSKLVAEQVLLHADAAGMPVAIFRLPRTSTASTGMAKADDVGSRLVAAVADVGMQPRGFSTRRIGEPADALSRIFVAISRNSRRRFKVYHCCDPRPTLHDAEPSDFGRYWPEVSYSTFKRACQARGKSSPLQGQLAILDYFAPYWFGIKDVGAALPICDRAMAGGLPASDQVAGTSDRRRAIWRMGRAASFPMAVPDCQ